MPKKEKYDPLDLVMYLSVRQDIKMSNGKIASQCGHAVQDLILMTPNPIIKVYKNNNNPKICLKINDLDEMDRIINECKDNNIQFYQVIDAGRTQVSINTPTVLGIGPISKDKVHKIVGSLKLF